MNKEIEKREQEYKGEVEKMWDRFRTIAWGRSPFQLKHFVVAEHDTPARQWHQTILEIQSLLFEMQRIKLEIDRKRLTLADLEEKEEKENNPRRAISIQEYQLQIAQADLSREARLRELDVLFAILKELEATNGGEPFTVQQIFEGEADYWAKRLTRQFFMSTRPSPGNMQAIFNTLVEPGEQRVALPMDVGEALKYLGFDVVPTKIGDNGKTPQELPDNA